MIYEIAQEAKKAIENNCDAYEIYIDESKSIQLDSRKEELNFAKEEIDRGVGIRVIKDNKIGFAFTSNMDKIAETAKHSIENTKLNKTDENYAFAEVEEIPSVKKVYDKKFNELDLDESIEFLKNTIDTTIDQGCDITGSGFSASEGKSLILNSNGVSIEDEGTGFSIGLSVNIQKDGKIATAYNSQSSRFFDLDGEKLAIEVCNLAKSSLDTKPIETNNYDVVLDYYAATGLLQTFMNAFNGENVMRGRSILKDKINFQIANPNLSIIDNPLLEKGMYTSKCDGEGIVSQKTDLIKDGILNSFIYDIYTANKSGVKTTSNGLRGSYLTTPMISPTNLEFKFSDMKDLSEIKNGVLTTSVLGAHTANPISGDFSVEASNAFKIENGELSEPINKAMISGNIFEIMEKVEGLQSEIKQYGPFIIPKLLVHDLRVVGQNQ
ncbi:PmbA protein [Methanobrevibacter gottschalkii]|uniref:PmbA protein n=2 Tax=Methanobrevibacter gottschalkii TaxID=190974 RepID=A0A3N5B5F7_9EURY|nr:MULTISPECIES: TldD/PmbA family protein [Methanobrevibacter]MCQ2971497.1 TldD/PmbA family protein [archaeon]OEC95063.1 peptidase [Methanobrevibacter sp. A27]RPF52553.1 PmbA protein [Methanobrevibacter gottschalkii DSM 11977]SEK34762.1 PmbA protein [Methanobrevibacter gottschalkii]